MDKDEAYYPKHGETYDQGWTSKIILWAPGLVWFYYLICGNSPRGSNHFNPVSTCPLEHQINDPS
jgi:hypothetical protein